ncbi:Magnesium and cobalt transport protein CorA [metagenome]|uniref:Magnesium and cobalt transport protein CorA n=1 Tax=metagenome TaxID=256318 RepID=A0A2P2CD84_9ZZZZ
MIIDNAVYRQGVRVPMQCDPADLAGMRAGLKGDGDFVWIGLHQPSAEEMAQVVKVFGLHRYAVEDALQAHQRPKLASYGDSLLLVLKTLWYVDEDDAVETGEISVFIGSDFIVTVRHGEGSELHTARALLERKEQVLTHGPSAVVFAICDTVVDAYGDVASALEQDVDEVEASVFSPTRTDDSARIYTLKREISEVRRAVLPLREPIGRLADGQLEAIAPEVAPFFHGVADNLAKAWDIVDSLDRLLSTAFDAHLASISVRQNEDMRKISAGVALAAVPTLIAGIYGMNFDHMPELRWQYGYPLAIGLMVVIIGGLWTFFKRSGWL